MISVNDRLKNTVCKGENVGNQHIFLFQQCFEKTCPGSCKPGIVWQRVKEDSGVALGVARAAPIFSRKMPSSYNENVRILTFRLRTCNLNGASQSADICIGFYGNRDMYNYSPFMLIKCKSVTMQPKRRYTIYNSCKLSTFD